jgi:hypothetical protein
MGRLIDRVALVAAGGGIALAGGAVAAGPAGAATAGGVHATVVHSSQRFSPIFPTSKIKGQGSTAFYKPSVLTVAEDRTGGACTEASPPVSFVIQNTGTKAAHVTVSGSPFFKLPAGQTEDICVSGGVAGDQATFGLSNAKNTVTYAATLTITASD